MSHQLSTGSSSKCNIKTDSSFLSTIPNKNSVSSTLTWSSLREVNPVLLKWTKRNRTQFLLCWSSFCSHYGAVFTLSFTLLQQSHCLQLFLKENLSPFLQSVKMRSEHKWFQETWRCVLRQGENSSDPELRP